MKHMMLIRATIQKFLSKLVYLKVPLGGVPASLYTSTLAFVDSLVDEEGPPKALPSSRFVL